MQQARQITDHELLGSLSNQPPMGVPQIIKHLPCVEAAILEFQGLTAPAVANRELPNKPADHTGGDQD